MVRHSLTSWYDARKIVCGFGCLRFGLRGLTSLGATSDICGDCVMMTGWSRALAAGFFGALGSRGCTSKYCSMYRSIRSWGMNVCSGDSTIGATRIGSTTERTSSGFGFGFDFVTFGLGHELVLITGSTHCSTLSVSSVSLRFGGSSSWK